MKPNFIISHTPPSLKSRSRSMASCIFLSDMQAMLVFQYFLDISKDRCRDRVLSFINDLHQYALVLYNYSHGARVVLFFDPFVSIHKQANYDCPCIKTLEIKRVSLLLAPLDLGCINLKFMNNFCT